MPSFTCPSCKRTFHDLVNIDGPCRSCGASWQNDQTNQPYIIGGINIRRLAKLQRWIIWVALGLLVSMVCGMTGGMTFGSGYSMVLMLFFSVFQILIQMGALVLFILLMVTMRMHIAWVIICSILMLVPLLNLILLLRINGRATRVFKRAGLHVGIMGVQDEDVIRVLSFNHCRQCGYNLTGNVSGRCPECGLTISIAVALPIAQVSPQATEPKVDDREQFVQPLGEERNAWNG